jgi:Cof subfamily protein (haloacid dehalogenase superfamily)
MKYKALMLDVDGTLVPYDYAALPSQKVVAAVTKAQEKVEVCIVTGRSFGFLKPVLQKLSMHTGFAVVNNGAQVVNLKTGEIVREQLINAKDLEFIIKLFQQEDVPFYVKQDVYDLAYQLGYYTPGQPIDKAAMIFTDESFPAAKIERLHDQLSKLHDLSVNKQHHKNHGTLGLSLAHAKATKLHGIHEIAQQLDITTEEIIGVGDSYNDFPLLMASGLKVAMGNAVEDLKAIADYIAPSVEEDGVAHVIDKFVLS